MTEKEQQRVNSITGEIERLSNQSMKKKIDVDIESRIDDLSCELLAIEEKYMDTVRCDNCGWEGAKEDLVQFVEFATNKEVLYLDGCPNCKTDEYLTDV